MHAAFEPGAWGRLARIAALSAGILALAGCATGYSFVQPSTAGGGGYYTGNDTYSGQTYAGYYDTAPYYFGGGYFGGGYGYFGSLNPYFGLYGLGGYYGGLGYSTAFGVSPGFLSVWGAPGYFGCWNGCLYLQGRRYLRHGRYGHRGGHYFHHRGRYGHRHGRYYHHRGWHHPAGVASHPWSGRHHFPMRWRGAHRSGAVTSGAAHAPFHHYLSHERFADAPNRPIAGFMNRRPLPSAAFAPRRRMGVPAGGVPRASGIPARFERPRGMPAAAAFSHRPVMQQAPAPRAFQRAPAPRPVPAFRAPPPQRFVPVARPSAPRAGRARSRPLVR